MDAATPLPVTTQDLRDAKAVNDLAMAGTEFGILLRIATKGDNLTDMFLNCVIVLELVFCIIEAKEAQRWRWKNDRHIPELIQGPPNKADLATAWHVKSFRLGSGTLGATLVATDGDTVERFYFRCKLLAALLVLIDKANDRAGWWDTSMHLRPSNETRL